MRYNLSNALEQKQFELQVAKYIADGECVDLTKKSQRRTLPQNKLFHVWVAVVADAVGEANREACKRDIKRALLGCKIETNRFTGVAYESEWHTSKMTVEQMTELMNRMKAWASTELNVYLPSPDEAGYIEMIERYG